MMASSRPLWQPTPERAADTQISRFRRLLEVEWGVRLSDYAALHSFSVDQREKFWSTFWTYGKVIGDWDGKVVLEQGETMTGARWFPRATLNFAENLLWRNDDTDALVFRSEAGARRTLTFAALRRAVGATQALLQQIGVEPGDVVAGYLPNVPEAVIAMLAATSLGAVWTAVAPDLSSIAAIDRLAQLKPVVLVTADATRHRGSVHIHVDKVREVVSALASLRTVLVVPYVQEDPDISNIPAARRWTPDTSLSPGPEPIFKRFPFGQPAFVLFSSGTTGRPKCIVHAAGGSLIQMQMEHILHEDIRAGDRALHGSTSTGWIIWNWMTGVLGCGATLVLYDGSPLYPRIDSLFDVVQSERATFFGPPARLLDMYAKGRIEPKKTHDLSALRTIVSGGSLVAAANYVYAYESIKEDVCFNSSSGGTDIFATFVNGDPAGAVWPGEMGVATLGMDVEILDDRGRALERGPGELVCKSPFPTIPVPFRDLDYRRLLDTYFTTYPGKWRHGDWIERTEHGGYVILGRSDATLNARGHRIGTAEIYRPLEAIEEIEDCAAVTQEWDNDLRIVLFVQLRSGCSLDSVTAERIRTTIRSGASPRHVPHKIVAVPELPRNILGKVLEVAIRETIHGRALRNLASISNPDSLRHFSDVPDLRF